MIQPIVRLKNLVFGPSSKKKINQTTEKISAKNMELAKLKIEKQSIREKINEMKNPSVLAEMNAFEQKKQELKEDISELKGEMKNNQSEIKNILGPEGENIEKIY